MYCQVLFLLENQFQLPYSDTVAPDTQANFEEEGMINNIQYQTLVNILGENRMNMKTRNNAMQIVVYPVT